MTREEFEEIATFFWEMVAHRFEGRTDREEAKVEARGVAVAFLMEYGDRWGLRLCDLGWLSEMIAERLP